MASQRDAPRVLTVTFEFTIPPGTPTNIRTARRMETVGAMTAAVAAIAGRALPPETEMTSRHQWGYVWHDKTTDPVTLGPPGP